MDVHYSRPRPNPPARNVMRTVERTLVRENSGGLVYFKRQFHRLGEPTAVTV